MPLPTNANDPSLRSNRGKWAVPTCRLPAVAAFMADALPPEAWDPAFLGQHLETTYLDTTAWDLRRARAIGDPYLTLRLRCYRPPTEAQEIYALSVKTEAEKWRTEVTPALAELVIAGQGDAALRQLLPPHLLARLQALAAGPLVPIGQTCYRRYAVEGQGERYTLDVDVQADTGKRLPFAVLEFKAVDADADPGSRLAAIGLRPMKLSKFLWSTEV